MSFILEDLIGCCRSIEWSNTLSSCHFIVYWSRPMWWDEKDIFASPIWELNFGPKVRQQCKGSVFFPTFFFIIEHGLFAGYWQFHLKQSENGMQQTMKGCLTSRSLGAKHYQSQIYTGVHTSPDQFQWIPIERNYI